MNPLKEKLVLLLKECRPRQWLKNLVVFTFIGYSGLLSNGHDFIRVSEIFFVFILLTSCVYIINDIIDRENDLKHEDKKNRPIASGKLSIRFAIISAIIFFIIGAIWSLFLGEYIFALYVFYLVLMITYSFVLKNLVLIDAITIAIGFVSRVIAGAIVIDAPASSYVVILIISVALLLAFGKRRAEITRLGNTRGISHRKVLAEYPVQLLDSLLSGLFATTFFAYILLTFQQELGKTNPILSSYLPNRYNNPHWLKFTIPVVFYGLARYMYLVYVKKEGGAFEELIVKDKALLSAVIIWVIMALIIIYSPII